MYLYMIRPKSPRPSTATQPQIQDRAEGVQDIAEGVDDSGDINFSTFYSYSRPKFDLPQFRSAI